MINEQLLHPASIVVVGASNNVHKPGGAILKNLISGGYAGELRAVNPKETEVQGVKAYPDVHAVPDTDLAVLAIPAVGRREECPRFHHPVRRIWRGDARRSLARRPYIGYRQSIWRFAHRS